MCIFLSNSSVNEEFLILEAMISAKIFVIALGEVNTGVYDLIWHTSLSEKEYLCCILGPDHQLK